MERLIQGQQRVYTILGELGTGGQGTCLELESEGQRYVAKVVQHRLAFAGLTEDDSIGKELKKEFEVLRGLNHPGIANFVEVVEDRRFCALIREKAEGRTLDEILAEGVLTERKVVEYLLKVCDILEYTHDASQHPSLGVVVHRDLKPKNIVVDADENVKLIDFGVARTQNGKHTTVTFGGGSFDYAAPEQFCRNEDCGPWTDIYALGVTGLELITGGVSDDLKSHKIRGRYKVPESVSPKLRNIFSRMIEKEIPNRYRNVAELRRDLMALNGLEAKVGNANIDSELVKIRRESETIEGEFKKYRNRANVIILIGMLAFGSIEYLNSTSSMGGYYCALAIPVLRKGIDYFSDSSEKKRLKRLRARERELLEQKELPEGMTLRDYFVRERVNGYFVNFEGYTPEQNKAVFLGHAQKLDRELFNWIKRYSGRRVIGQSQLEEALLKTELVESSKEARRVVEMLVEQGGIQIDKDYALVFENSHPADLDREQKITIRRMKRSQTDGRYLQAHYDPSRATEQERIEDQAEVLRVYESSMGLRRSNATKGRETPGMYSIVSLEPISNIIIDRSNLETGIIKDLEGLAKEEYKNGLKNIQHYIIK
jgi:serine/threonine protein kinase